MNEKLFLINIRFNNIYYFKAFINSGYLYYTIISEDLYRRLNLPRIAIPPRRLDGVASTINRTIKWITYISIDLDRY